MNQSILIYQDGVDEPIIAVDNNYEFEYNQFKMLGVDILYALNRASKENKFKLSYYEFEHDDE